MENEKLYITVRAIAEAKEITRKGHPVKVYLPMRGAGDGEILPEELKDILLKLHDDERIISVISFPAELFPYEHIARVIPLGQGGARHDPPENHFVVDTLDTFDKWYADYRTKTKGLTEDLSPAQSGKAIAAPESGIVYQITFTKAREVLLNGDFQLAKPDFNSENDLVFTHLYEHQNKKITRVGIEEQLKMTLTKSLHKIVENLGFKGDLKKVFFSVSKNSILFRNPITREDLERLGVPRIRLS